MEIGVEPAPSPAWRRRARAFVPWSFAGLLGCVILQVGLAGAGLLTDPDFLQSHRDFALVVQLVPVACLAVALLGRDLPAAAAAGAIALLIAAQGPLIAATGFIRSLHVLNSLVIFAVCLLVLRERFPAVRRTP